MQLRPLLAAAIAPPKVAPAAPPAAAPATIPAVATTVLITLPALTLLSPIKIGCFTSAP